MRFGLSRAIFRTLGTTLAMIAMAGNVHADGILRITEVMSSGDVQDWFELTNYGTSAISIANHRLDDASFDITKSHPLTLLNSASGTVTTVAPSESVVFIESNEGANHSNLIATFRSNWGLASTVNVGYYFGSGLGLSGSGDGATVFSNTSGNGGTELSGPFGGKIRVSFGAATEGSSFRWLYDSLGNRASVATGELSVQGGPGVLTWTNGAVSMYGSPGASEIGTSNIINWVGGAGTWAPTGGTDWTAPGQSAGGWNSSKSATFGGTAGTVTLGDDVTALGLEFDTTGYTINPGVGDHSITLTGGSVTANIGTVTVDAEIAGTAGLSKAGLGTVVLTAPNTYSGATSVIDGSLTVGTGGSLPTGTTVAVGLNATLNFGGVSTEVGGLAGLGNLTMGPATITIDVADSNLQEFNGSLAGTGGVIIDSTGSGIQRFDLRTASVGKTKSYTGATTVREGTLEIGFDGVPTATSEVNVEAGSVLALTSAVSKGIYSIAGGAAPINLQGGDLRNGAGDVAGETTSIANVVDVQQASTVTVVPGGNGSGGTIILGGGVSGTSGLTIGGTGTVRMAAGGGYSGAVSVGSTAILSGNFEAGSVGGAGRVSPGNSPGVATTGQVNPTGGLDFDFEYTAAGAPVYGTPGASVNDVLRVTDTVTPFTSNLGASNSLNVYLDVASLGVNSDPVFQGGFFAEMSAESLFSAVQNASLNVFVRGNSGGSVSFNGVNYYSLSDWNTLVDGDYVATLGTFGTSANFGSGSVNGAVTTVSVVGVPEPSTYAFACLGGLFAAAHALRRRKQAG